MKFIKSNSFATLFLILLIGSTAIWLSRNETFLSPDCGARFAMIRSQIDHGHLIYTYYPNADLDPTGQVHPLAYFLYHRSGDFCAMYLPLFPLVTGVFYRLFGFGGLMIVPVLSGLGTILVFYKTAERLEMRSRYILPWVLGLATPLLLYSVIYWDHSLQMFITALAGYWVLRALQERSFSCAAIAGTVFGLGIWIHELFLAFFVAAFLSSLPFLKERRFVPGGLLVGFVPIVLAWVAYNLWTYGGIGGGHLGANVVQNNADHPFSLIQILDPSQFAERAMVELVGTPIFGSRDNIFPHFMVFVGLLIVYTFVGWAGPLLRRVALLLGILASGMAFYLYWETRGAPDGLLEATPLLIPALAIPWIVQKVEGTATTPGVFFAWASRACSLFALFILINPMLPGVDWGSRYLLAALPILVLLAAYAVEQQVAGLRKYGRTAALVSVGGMVGVSLTFQVFGLLWINRSLAYGHELNTRIAAISAPVMVTDTDLNARLTDSSRSQSRFVVRTASDQLLLASIIRKLHPSEVVFVGTESGQNSIEGALSAAEISYTLKESRPLWRVNHVRQEGDELLYARFVRVPAK